MVVRDSQLRVIWVETKEDLVLEVHAPPWNHPQYEPALEPLHISVKRGLNGFRGVHIWGWEWVVCLCLCLCLCVCVCVSV